MLKVSRSWWCQPSACHPCRESGARSRHCWPCGFRIQHQYSWE